MPHRSPQTKEEALVVSLTQIRVPRIYAARSGSRGLSQSSGPKAAKAGLQLNPSSEASAPPLDHAIFLEQPPWSLTSSTLSSGHGRPIPSALRNELLRLAGNEPDESTSYQGMVDFHWGFAHLADAERMAAALSQITSRSDIVLLRLSNCDNSGCFDHVQGRAIHQTLAPTVETVEALPGLDDVALKTNKSA